MSRFQLGLFVLLAAPMSLGFAAPGDTALISVTADGTKAAGNSDDLVTALSADGRFVAFASVATNLVPNDTDGVEDVFVRDLSTGVTERTIAGGDDFAMSADGRFIVVGTGGIYVYDRQAGTTERVDVSSSGEVANKLSLEPTISANGRYVAFISEATNLVPNTSPLYDGVFVHDRQTGITSRVNITTTGQQGNGFSVTRPGISADGRYVAFGSDATNLVPNVASGLTNVYVRDRQLGKTELVSVNSAGVPGNLHSNDPAMSADGNRVCFWSTASNLVANDTNFAPDVFVHDRATGKTMRADVASDGTETSGGADVTCALSGNGRYVVFQSTASDLVPGDTNGLLDVFWHDFQTGETERASVATNGAQGNGQSLAAAISDDGQLVTFVSAARNLSGKDSNNTEDVFSHEPGGPGTGPETVGYTLRPTALNFGTAAVGSSSIRNFFLKNTGNVVLSIASIELSGTNSNQFVMVSSCGSSVGVSATCRIRIYFRPTSVGHKVAQLTVVAGGKPARVRNISGTAQ